MDSLEPPQKKLKTKSGKDKRRRYDNKGRELHTGEYQKASGMYEYRYKEDGIHSKSIYSWKLLPDDIVPMNQNEMCLRDRIKCLQGNTPILDSEIPTLSELFKECMRESNLSTETVQNYYFAFRKHYKAIHKMPITSIKSEDVYVCLKRFATKDKPSLSTLRNTLSIINKVFQYGIQIGIIDENPTKYIIEELRYDGVLEYG